jgi:predicted dehydrogenase
MAEYLRLVVEGKVQLEAILEREYEVAAAAQAYEELRTAAEKPLGVLLRYPADGSAEKQTTQVHLERLASAVKGAAGKNSATGKINVALVGAGGFAKGVHLPNMQQMSDLYQLHAVVSSTGANAMAVAKQFGAAYATTRFADVLNDPEIHAILIATRHHLHAQQAEAAALAGKAVFVEKPMALNPTELESLVTALGRTGVPYMVGFNRRFSPAALQARQLLGGRRSPMLIVYRVNAGYLSPDHWTQGPEGGGRIVGEACHMFDLFQFLAAPARPVEVSTFPLQADVDHLAGGDSIATMVRYSDGSVASLAYEAVGAPDLPKEYVEIHAEGKTLVIDDFKALHVHGVTTPGWQAAQADKGHTEELRAFGRYVRGEIGAPITLVECIDTTRVSFVAAGIKGF